MRDDVRDLGGDEPRVQRAEDSAREGDGEVRLEERRFVLREDGDALAVPNAERLQEMSETVDAFEHLRVRAADRPVDDGDLFAKDERGAFEVVERREAAQMDRGR